MGKSSQQQELNINGVKVAVTSPDKPLWPKKGLKKIHYLEYLTRVAPYLLPFLRNRALTVIRYPHGVDDERFYQKNCPDYAPDFIETVREDQIDYIVCNTLPSLLWLGNQLAFELHIPFRKNGTSRPSEIVMDLDPPSRDEFVLSVEAALLIKEVCDKLKLKAFVKTSGNKGLQVYVPLPENEYTFDDTRRFTQFLAQFLITKEPGWFTIERLKKNRGNKCYIDFIQHAEGKTIIAPYSVRGNEEALVATPLWWDELERDLRPEAFPLDTIQQRLEKTGDPFAEFEETKSVQRFDPVLDWLKEQKL
ncbi:non-homologous end-joining DNA ligase [Fictibacillus terranigra]|uniref:Non-homologous end-joining DNA ligase n=1 Tax=Fictibacillus terranigra TaxID=3058424 RepID=A0ABT8E762_9BACL|nr:non-homologous end-joining DNA ligase [Fictibacillus sp. CENA-BCM004]MDN4073741.1 non-homologous end-joining DNA ligase [Fictibacillus sp. CENA-BCM004]